MRWLVVVAVMVASVAFGAEVLQNVAYRAVTLEPGERKSFRVPTLERVNATSGSCVEEGMELDEAETFWLQATCGGVRTALVWRADGRRVHVMACAEDAAARPAHLVKLRVKMQAELKSKQQTACVRNGRVELWGWASTAEEKGRLDALERKLGEDKVKNFVEVLEATE